MKKILRSHDTQLAVLLILISLTGFASLWWAGNIDYDGDSLINISEQMLGSNIGYEPNRHPGSPVFELVSATLVKIASMFNTGRDVWKRLLQIVVQIFGCGLLLLMFFDLRKLLNRGAAFFATLCLALHPMYLWHAASTVEDIPALFFAYFSFRMVRDGKNLFWAGLWMSVALNCKGLAIHYFLATLCFAFSTRSRKEMMEYFLFTSILCFLFYLPALAYYRFDLAHALSTPTYGSRPEDRPGLAWTLVRTSLFFPIVFALALLIERAKRRLTKTRITHDVSRLGDLALGVVLAFSFFPFYEALRLRYFVALTLILSLGLFVKSATRDQKKVFLRDMLPLLVLLCTSFALFASTPFSRSFLFFAIPPLLLLFARRFQSKKVWGVAALFTFAPVFFNYEVSARATPYYFVVHPHGYYYSLTRHAHSEYNDWGYMALPPLFSIPAVEQ